MNNCGIKHYLGMKFLFIFSHFGRFVLPDPASGAEYWYLPPLPAVILLQWWPWCPCIGHFVNPGGSEGGERGEVTAHGLTALNRCRKERERKRDNPKPSSGRARGRNCISLTFRGGCGPHHLPGGMPTEHHPAKAGAALTQWVVNSVSY